MRAFAHDLREAAALSVPPAAVAGSLLLSADLVDAMRADGPRATLIALAVVLLVTWLSFRRAGRLALASVAAVAVGVCLMLAVLVLTGEKVNFCNFVALPITFGIGADYSINVLSRWQASGGRDVGAAVASTGGAVALCSLTTIIGFGSLLVAQNRALHSFGVLAVAGELTCLVTAVLALPAALVVWGRHIEAPPPAWSANAR
jgi:hypothetical protein